MLGLLFASLLAAQNYGPIISSGGALTAAAAEQLESSLRATPGDLNTRARLLGYYAAHAVQDPAARRARIEQVEWLVKNEPGSMILHNTAARLQPSDFTPPNNSSLDSLRAAWDDQVRQRPNDPLVFENAYFSTGNAEMAANGGERIEGWLKRLRAIEPGDPEWAFDLAGLYVLALTRSLAPGATPDAKRWTSSIQAGLEKSPDTAVVGLTGLMLYASFRMLPNQSATQAANPLLSFAEAMLRRAAEMNPKNPGWAGAFAAPPPKNAAELGAVYSGALRETDLWPGGVVRAMSLPPGAVRLSAAEEAAKRPPLGAIALQRTAIGSGCTAQFEALIGRDGRIKDIQVTGFEHLNIPFVSTERDALRQAQYPPVADGLQQVESVAQIDAKCPAQVATIIQDGLPPAGVVGGIPGGIAGGVAGGVGGAAPPPPPPPPPPNRPATDGSGPQRVSPGVQAAKLLKHPAPVYPAVAKQARIQGRVVLQAIVAKDGTIESLKLLSATSPLLVQSAMDAVKQWVYQPTLLYGEPVRVLTEVTVNFILQ